MRCGDMLPKNFILLNQCGFLSDTFFNTSTALSCIPLLMNSIINVNVVLIYTLLPADSSFSNNGNADSMSR
ncbi:hypothetical protein RB653_002364 [Dictyostelium firmibasis]|uniref:Uncharacterized protein n=1 Tax=Dictyostelium firmibasis TaxID=79012 RepID=A0AAN7TXB0_9MYCE